MKTTLNLGKIDYEGSGKANLVILKMEIKTGNYKNRLDTNLRPVSNCKTLSISGQIWDKRHFDCVTCGQISDTILKYYSGNERVERIVEIWERWHLNDLSAGTESQKECLKNSGVDFSEYRKAGYESYYDYERFVLEQNGLLYDGFYEFGSQWLVEPLPDEIESEIIELFENQTT
jgi:hypothetical protein